MGHKRLLIIGSIVLIIVSAAATVAFFLYYPAAGRKLSRTAYQVCRLFDPEYWKMKRWEQMMDIYHQALQTKDLALCDHHRLTQELRILCRAKISGDVDECKALQSLPEFKPYQHAQCIEDIVTTDEVLATDKSVCDGLQNYEDKQYYYHCRALRGSDLAECEKIITESKNDTGSRGDYETAVGDCMLDVINQRNDGELCQELERIEQKYGFSNFYSSTCWEKYDISRRKR